MVRTRPVSTPSSSTPGAGAAPQADSAEAGEAEPASQQTAAGAALEGVEVWWSWDPVFLFRQMGWKECPPAKAQQAAEGTDAGAAPTGAEAAEGGAEGDAASKEEPVTEENDLCLRTAAAARRAYATEAEAVEAAAAAVAASAAAAERVGESAEALAAAQAANRAVVELYFHTYNTGAFAPHRDLYAQGLQCKHVVPQLDSLRRRVLPSALLSRSRRSRSRQHHAAPVPP